MTGPKKARKFGQDDREWWKRGPCHIDNRPRHPSTGNLMSEADLDVMFFPTARAEIERQSWKWFCNHCPVRNECASWGAQSKSCGVYGGEYIPYPSSVDRSKDKVKT